MNPKVLEKVMGEFRGLSDKALAARRKKKVAPDPSPEHEAMESGADETKEHAAGVEAQEPDNGAPAHAACDCGMPECGTPDCKCGKPECEDAEPSDEDKAMLMSHYEGLEK